MAKTAKFTKSDVLRAIRGDPEALPPAVKKTDDPLELLWDDTDDKRQSSYGHIPTIAARLGCSDQTVRNYKARLDKKTGQLTRQAQDIASALEAEKKLGMARRADFHVDLLRDSEKALRENVRLLDVPSIKFALERLDKGHYSSRSELTGADGDSLYDDEAKRMLAELYDDLEQLGTDPSEQLINAIHAMRTKVAAMKNRGRGDE